MLPIQTPPYREPALDADCHCSFISASVDDSLHLQEIKSQVRYCNATATASGEYLYRNAYTYWYLCKSKFDLRDHVMCMIVR